MSTLCLRDTLLTRLSCEADRHVFICVDPQQLILHSMVLNPHPGLADHLLLRVLLNDGFLHHSRQDERELTKRKPDREKKKQNEWIIFLTETFHS